MPDPSRYQYLHLTTEDAVAIVTLNRPDALNAVNWELHRELETIWLDLADDEAVRAIVLTGAGRAFSAGGDLRRMLARAQNPAERDPYARRIQGAAYQLVERMLNVPQPIIAAVNGAATGLGATLALCCDIVIASDQARIGDTHVRAGLVAGDGGALIWPWLVGMHRAKQYLLTGDLIDAREAERIGLINQVVPHAQLMPTAMAFARRLADGAPWAIRWTKAALNTWLKLGATLIMPAALAYEGHTMLTRDHGEAVAAFLEKRPPRFLGL